MEWLVDNVKDTDNVFIFYTGHGEFKTALNKGYWVPADATSQTTAQYISNSDIQTFLGGIKSKHTLLVSDACFSGDLFRGKTVSIPFENSDNYYKKVYDLSSRQALTSGGVEPVMDGGKEGHSIFSYYFLKTLENNGGRFLDAGQLYEGVKIPVINNYIWEQEKGNMEFVCKREMGILEKNTRRIPDVLKSSDRDKF